MESRYVRIHNIDKVGLSHPKAKFNSFKICMHKDDIGIVHEHNFWPRGVWCDEWRDPWEERRRSTDDQQQQRQEDGSDGEEDTSDTEEDTRTDGGDQTDE